MCCFLKKKVKGKGIEAAVLARASWLSPAVPARLPRGSRQARAQGAGGPPVSPTPGPLALRRAAYLQALLPAAAPAADPAPSVRGLRGTSQPKPASCAGPLHPPAGRPARCVCEACPGEAGFLHRQGRGVFVNITSHRTVHTSRGFLSFLDRNKHKSPPVSVLRVRLWFPSSLSEMVAGASLQSWQLRPGLLGTVLDSCDL